MSGILGGIVNALGAVSQGQNQANQSRLQSALQEAQITRQQQQDQIASAIREREANSSLLKDRLTQAQITDTEQQAQQRAYEVAHPKPTKPNYAPPVIGPNGQVQLINYDDPTHPVKVPGVQGKIEHEPQGPRDQVQLVQTPGPNGPVYYRVNLTTGEKTPLDLSAVPKGGRAAGGGASGAQVPVADMEARYKEIADAATSLGNGEWKFTSGMQTREGLNYANAIGNAAGHPSMTHQLLAGTLNTFGAGGEDYPKYQALLNATRSLGDDVAKVFKGRQNEQSVLREVALSELTPDDYNNPQVVKQKLDRLQHVIALAKMNNPDQADLLGTPGTEAPQGSGASHAQQLWDAAVAKHGQAKVLQEFGPRPTQ